MCDVVLSPIEGRHLESRNPEDLQEIIETNRNTNYLLPPVSLPPELLVKVFRYAVRDNSGTPDQLFPYPWLGITRVCHRWRQVALGAPELWRTIWVTTLDCTREMLARSQQMPLIVKGDMNQLARMGQAKYNEILDCILRELRRIVILDVCIVEFPMPELEHYPEDALMMMKLVFHSFANPSQRPGGSLVDPLLTYLLNVNAPNLERVKLYLPCIQWKMIRGLVRNTLKILTLSGDDEKDEEADFVMGDVLHVLGSLPQLEKLVLRSALPEPPGDPPELVTFPTILPNLRSLTIADTVTSCANLLRRTSFPPDVKMSLHCTYRSQRSVPGLVDAIRSGPSFQRYHGTQGNLSSPPQTIRTLVLRGPDTTDITQLRAWTTYHSLDQLYSNIRERLKTPLGDYLINITLKCETKNHFPALQLVRAFPLDNIETVLLRPAHKWASKCLEMIALNNLLFDLPSLRELDMGRFATPRLPEIIFCSRLDEVDVVLPPSTPGEPTQMRRVLRENLIFPDLSVLGLDMVDVVPGEYMRHDVDHFDGDGDDFLEEIEIAFDIRRTVCGGKMFDRLVLNNCLRVTDGHAQKFARFANTLVREEAM
ncbi:hypothetical protein BDY19DRAFT_930333 [Irpex rosettiformis]|uniref:Uncharacterized protein n=1 Tax=Irpex rosettiformis TaxID=378272 RepID=A0ACB8UAY5_9APHY|nr:hypothetical protein BDY19DRAFT_930333 [Irpex rosettiformis]